MSRLIDADAMKEQIEKAIKAQNGNGKDYVKVSEVFLLIDSRETAYDVDKVVEQLNEAIEDTTDGETGLGARWAYKGAIEIVKKGGKE